MRIPSLIAAVLLLCPMAGAAQVAQHAAQPPGVDTTALMTTGADALVARKYAEAAVAFERAASLDPENAQAQYWAGQSLVYGDKPEQAIHYLERAHALGSDSVALHLAMVAAYAGALKTAERDEQLQLLHAWHTDGEHLTLAHAQGFLMETIFTPPWHINVMEYFEPDARHLVWRFTVRDAVEIIESTYVLREETTPGGERTYELVRYGGEAAVIVPENSATVVFGETKNTQAVAQASAGIAGGQPIKTYEKKPPYDVVRVDVLQRVRSLVPSRKK